MFDPNAFVNSTAEPMQTQMSVCPEGEFLFMVDSDPKGIVPKNMKGVSGPNAKNPGQPYDFWQMELNCVCLDDGVKAQLGRQKVVVRYRVNLDLNGAGGLDSGPDKNISLGRLREALNQNKPGWKPADLLGAGPFLGKVEHESSKGNTYANITRVAKPV